MKENKYAVLLVILRLEISRFFVGIGCILIPISRLLNVVWRKPFLRDTFFYISRKKKSNKAAYKCVYVNPAQNGSLAKLHNYVA